MYLVHYSFVILLMARASRQGLPWSLAYATYLATTVALATLVCRGYEGPMTRLREALDACSDHLAALLKATARNGRSASVPAPSTPSRERSRAKRHTRQGSPDRV